MRICILSDYYYPQLGGITEHVHGQAVNLAARGHEVTILTGRIPHAPRAADRDERVLVADGVELVHMGLALPLYGNGSQTLHTVLPGGTRQLRRFLGARRFDVVHIHAPYNPSFFMLAPFALPAGAVGVGTYHSVFTPGRVRDLVHAPTRASLGRLHGHVVVSEACIEPLDHYFPELDWRVIPNGIDEQHFSPAAAPLEELRASGDPVILFLGRFDPRNGLGIMLDAFDRVWRERDGHARLCVVGDGPLRRYYERRLAPEVAAAVHWAGRVDWNRPRYYASADVFCTPCQRASFGMVLLEAMSCARPVVASRISGFQMLLTSGREGLLVAPPDDPAAFAAALAHLLDSPAELGRMGAEGRRTATGRYAWSAVAAELEAYYLELRGETPRAPARARERAPVAQAQEAVAPV
ncbi:MAG TPA: glycosyltransferase family 4 protein [Gaiellales bacterium]